MSARDQIASLLPKFSLPARAREKIDEFISNLEKKLTSLEPSSTAQPLSNQTVLETVKLPLSDKSFSLPASFLFKPPTRVTAVGSYALGCIAREKIFSETSSDDQTNSHFVVDLALEIPKECWQKKDHLNYVYHRKRAFYLAYVANRLQKWKNLFASVHFAFHHGDHMKPMIVLEPAGKLGSVCRFNILAFAPVEKKASFALTRFAPEKCNVQAALFDATLQLPASPHYNASLLQDLTMLTASEKLGSFLSGKTNLLEALVLLRVWLERRDLRRYFAHSLTAYACYLLKKGQLNPSAPAFQIFKAIVQQLVTSPPWDSKGIAFDSSSSEEADSFNETEVVAPFHGYYEVVFVDVSSGHNLAGSITLDLYERLLYDLKLLNSRLANNNLLLAADISSILNEQIEYHKFFDYYLHVSTDVCAKSSTFLEGEPIFLETGFNAVYVLVVKLLRLLRKAVGERLSLLQAREFAVVDQSWPVTATPPYKSAVQYVTVGMLINSQEFESPITKGPPADDVQAAGAFRAFWGERAEIRRFANGDICEAVVWPNSTTAQEKRRITYEMIAWTLNRLLPTKVKLISGTFAHLDRLLEMPNLKLVKEGEGGEIVPYGTGEHFLALASGSMVSLKRHLHSLNGSLAAFSVVDVVGIDPVLRSTEVFPPLPIRAKPSTTGKKLASGNSFANLFDFNGEAENIDKLRYIKPVEVVVKIEITDPKALQLPSEPTAIANTRYIIHYELGKALVKLQQNDLLVRPTSSYLDVLYGGHVFRIRTTLQREAAILRQLANTAKAVKSVECPAADELEFTASVLPPLSACLRGLAAEHPAFGLTCRLFKRWLSTGTQLGHYFRPITVDLLVAAVFLPGNTFAPGYPVPGSPEAGLLRVLHFLASHDFARSPVIVSFGSNLEGGSESSLNASKMSELVASFTAERHRLPPLTIVTPYERSKLSVHSRKQPSAPVLFHTVRLARLAAEKMDTQLTGSFRAAPVTSYLFPANRAELLGTTFDLLIHLKTKAVPTKAQALDFPSGIVIRQTLYSDESVESGQLKQVMPVVDFNPVSQYLETLKGAFDNLALFFVDEHGGRSIGVLLRPEAMAVKPFKLASLAGQSAAMLTETAYSSSVDNVALNLGALMEDMAIMGEGLVEKVLLGGRQK